MTTQTKGRTVERTLTIKAPPEVVWKALTEAEELKRWFPTDARTKPGKGGLIWISWGAPWEGECAIDIWEPGRHLRTAWPWSGGSEPFDKGTKPVLYVDYFLEGKGGETTLRLVHSGFGMGAEWDTEYEGVSNGWNFELRSLRHYIERHLGKDRRVVWSRKRTPLEREEVWRRLTNPAAFAVTPAPTTLKEGGAYTMRTPWGDKLEGETRVSSPPIVFAGTVRALNDALVRLEISTCANEKDADKSEVWFWLSMWGVAKEKVAELEKKSQGALDAILG